MGASPSIPDLERRLKNLKVVELEVYLFTDCIKALEYDYLSNPNARKDHITFKGYLCCYLNGFIGDDLVLKETKCGTERVSYMKPQTFVSAIGIMLLLKHPDLVGPSNFIHCLNFPGGKELFEKISEDVIFADPNGHEIYDEMFGTLNNPDQKIKLIDEHNRIF